MTCQRLVKIDQSETGIKSTYKPLFSGPQNDQPNNAKEDMKYIVSYCSAGKTVLGRDEKPCNADQN
jgi:hypothetical protein